MHFIPATVRRDNIWEVEYREDIRFFLCDRNRSGMKGLACKRAGNKEIWHPGNHVPSYPSHYCCVPETRTKGADQSNRDARSHLRAVLLLYVKVCSPHTYRTHPISVHTHIQIQRGSGSHPIYLSLVISLAALSVMTHESARLPGCLALSRAALSVTSCSCFLYSCLPSLTRPAHNNDRFAIPYHLSTQENIRSLTPSKPLHPPNQDHCSPRW